MRPESGATPREHGDAVLLLAAGLLEAAASLLEAAAGIAPAKAALALTELQAYVEQMERRQAESGAPSEDDSR